MKKKKFVEECPIGNVVLACFTTAQARLYLYATMEKLFDTDSIIPQYKEGEFNPSIVYSLGGWTDELDGGRIIKIMTEGPKNYAFETDPDELRLKCHIFQTLTVYMSKVKILEFTYIKNHFKS